MFFNNNNAFYS